jgi:hypothetical protein
MADGARGEDARAWEELARTRWKGAVATVMVVVGVVLASVMFVDQWSAAETGRAMRQQELRLAARKVEATGSKLVSALATWSHHREEPAEEHHHEDPAELKWAMRSVLHRSSELAQELLLSDKAKRRAVESLAVPRAKAEVEEKDMAVVKDDLAQLRQEVKDRDGEVISARARISKGEEALISKELELAEVKKELSKRTATEKELLSKELEIAELKKQLSLRAVTDKKMLAATLQEHCQCQKDKAQIFKSILYTAFI